MPTPVCTRVSVVPCRSNFHFTAHWHWQDRFQKHPATSGSGSATVYRLAWQVELIWCTRLIPAGRGTPPGSPGLQDRLLLHARLPAQARGMRMAAMVLAILQLQLLLQSLSLATTAVHVRAASTSGSGEPTAADGQATRLLLDTDEIGFVSAGFHGYKVVKGAPRSNARSKLMRITCN